MSSRLFWITSALPPSENRPPDATRSGHTCVSPIFERAGKKRMLRSWNRYRHTEAFPHLDPMICSHLACCCQGHTDVLTRFSPIRLLTYGSLDPQSSPDRRVTSPKRSPPGVQFGGSGPAPVISADQGNRRSPPWPRFTSGSVFLFLYLVFVDQRAMWGSKRPFVQSQLRENGKLEFLSCRFNRQYSAKYFPNICSLFFFFSTILRKVLTSVDNHGLLLMAFWEAGAVWGSIHSDPPTLRLNGARFRFVICSKVWMCRTFQGPARTITSDHFTSFS